MLKPIFSIIFKSSLMVIFISLLVACGSSDDPSACSTQSIVITTSWDSNGGISTNVNGQVGIALTATPTITGIPASCQGQETFSSNVTLPTGLTLNSSTGVISGIPTQVVSIGANGIVKMSLPGYSDVDLLSIITIYP